MNKYTRLELKVDAIQWPESWEKQSAIAKYLGQHGITLQFENGHKAPGKRNYLPQLYLYTRRYDCVKVRIGDWIVLKSNREFDVVARDVFREEYAA